MTQDTTNKFAAILAAAQAKVNINPSFPNDNSAAPEISKVIPEIKALKKEIKGRAAIAPPVIIEAEKPTKIEFSDLQINTNGAIEEKAKIVINDYSEKAIVLTGETYPIRKDLKAMGAIFSYNFKCGAGWMFSKKRFNEVREQLQLF